MYMHIVPRLSPLRTRMTFDHTRIIVVWSKVIRVSCVVKGHMHALGGEPFCVVKGHVCTRGRAWEGSYI